MTITRTRPLSIRSLLLAAALALALIPALESRANAANSYSYFCGSTVPANSYCTKGSAWGPNQLYGFWLHNSVEGASGLRKCAIIDVYRHTDWIKVARFKKCGNGTHVLSNGVTSNYNNPWLYTMFSYVYNGSSKPQYLLGWAYGYKR